MEKSKNIICIIIKFYLKDIIQTEKKWKRKRIEGKLIFEGEYLDGKKWNGEAKVYDENTCNMIFEYKYSKGIIDGNGSEYDKYSGELLFSGYYLNGKRNGKGEEYKYIPCEKNSNYYYFADNLYSFEGRAKRMTIFSGE